MTSRGGDKFTSDWQRVDINIIAENNSRSVIAAMSNKP
jgi:hypothetical protein